MFDLEGRASCRLRKSTTISLVSLNWSGDCSADTCPQSSVDVSVLCIIIICHQPNDHRNHHQKTAGSVVFVRSYFQQSAVYSVKRKGARTVPWGAPVLVVTMSGTHLQAVTNCSQFMRFDQDHHCQWMVQSYSLKLKSQKHLRDEVEGT